MERTRRGTQDDPATGDSRSVHAVIVRAVPSAAAEPWGRTRDHLPEPPISESKGPTWADISEIIDLVASILLAFATPTGWDEWQAAGERMARIVRSAPGGDTGPLDADPPGADLQGIRG